MEPLDRVLFRALRAALGLTAEEGSRHLMRSYQDSPPANPGPGMNVCYYQIVTEARGKVLTEKTVEENVVRFFDFVPGRIILVFYGPDCERWAHRCREFLFLDGYGMPRKILREAGIFPVPDMYAPSVVYEEIGKSWRKRADLVVSVRIRMNEEYGSVISGERSEVSTVAEAPEVVVDVGAI